MKRLLALLLCLMLVFPAALAEDAASDHDAIRDEWLSILKTYEAIYMVQDWALARAEKFLETAQWEDLRLARLAAGSAIVYLQHMVDIPTPTLSSDTYVNLFLEDQDYTFIPEQYNLLEIAKTTAVNILVGLQDRLNHDVFWKYHDQTFRAWAKCERETLHIDMQTAAIMTNAVAAVPGSADILEADKALFVAAAPTILGAYDQWKTDPTELEADYAAQGDLLAIQEQRSNEILGMITADGDLYISIAAAGDIAPLMADAVTINGLPMMLPEPTWPMEGYPKTDYLWYNEETAEALYWTPGTEPKPYKPVANTKWNQVSRADFDDYVSILTELGLPFTKDDASDSKRTLYYLDGTHTFFLTWTPEATELYTTGTIIFQAPLWYIFAVFE